MGATEYFAEKEERERQRAKRRGKQISLFDIQEDDESENKKC
jgi:hypothetical protein|tara:strand:- start:322 stop:447 length:126 start_codon:yes stop_codon:yes gene_type:complete